MLSLDCKIQGKGKNNIVWLASYPKSGNTWFRMFLTNLLAKSETPKHLNQILSTGIASSRELFDDYTGVPASDLYYDEIDALRPALYRKQSISSDKTLYKKIHDAYLMSDTSEPMIPRDVTAAVLYLIRNPLDVAVSFANHLQVSIDKSIDVMEDEHYAFCSREGRIHNQLRQKLLTWSMHVNSWTTQQELPLMPLRYEDMYYNPFPTFKKATRFLGLADFSDEDIKRAIQHADFSILKKQEDELGFKEKPPKTKEFFRKGTVGDFRELLTYSQMQRIIETHGEVMEKFGYLNADGELTI